MYRQALAASRETLGDRHPETLGSIGNLGDLQRQQGKHSEARRLLGAAAADAREVLGDRHLIMLVIEAKLARVAQESGAGAQELQAVVARMEAALGSAHPQTVKYAGLLHA